jgi:uncharacterized membrane protein
MSLCPPAAPNTPPPLTNGSGAAAILSAGIGSFVLAVLAIAADQAKAIEAAMNFSKPTGALSGVTTVALLFWLVVWGLLDLRWRKKTIALKQTCIIAFVLLALSFLLTFPPVADLF